MHFEKQLSHEIMFRGKIVDVFHDRVELENGKTALREVISHPGAVGILAKSGSNLLLVRQFRYAVGRELLEIPAGKLEGEEPPESAAARELREETGALCGELIPLGCYYASPGILSEVIHLYFTAVTGLSAVQPDDDEFVSAVEMNVHEFAELIAKGEINDGKTVFAFAIASAKGLLL